MTTTTKHTASSHDQPQNIPPESIARLLTSAAGQLDAETVTALRRARNAALEKQLQHKPVFALSTGHSAHRLLPHSPQQWVAVAILLAALLASMVGYWHDARQQDANPLDIAILTDDLPMHVFVDP